MGKLFGFLEYERELPLDRDPIQRLNDWEEIHGLLPLDKQKQQAARCMHCAVPFCQSGMTIKGVPTGCPLGNLIPEWNDLLYREEWELAKERLLRTNSFPEFTGRVCPALCEGACTCGVNQPQITVRQNEVSIIEHAFASGSMTPRLPKKRTGKKVAVVGSGPAGLACANLLNQLGHSVTVLERHDRIGGLLMYGIPNMKLDKKIVNRRVDLMKAEGIYFVTGQTVTGALAGFDATVLCCGSGKARDLRVPGREGKGVALALDYLTVSTRHVLDASCALPPELNARGKDVVIIGGGDTGTDCVGTALRQGCRSVRQLEIMPKPSETRTAANPWPEYPKVLKTDYGQAEAIAKFGGDPRQYLTQTCEILLDGQQQARALTVEQVEWVCGEGGRMTPQSVEKTKAELPAQLILIAMGFVGPEDALPDVLGLKRDARSNVMAAHYETSQKGVFTAGDMHSGQSLVVRAINEGQQAALACHQSLI